MSMSRLRSPPRRVACAALLSLGVAPAADTLADDARAGAAVYESGVREAALGDARIRERERGLRLWSPEFAGGSFAFRAGADYAYTRYEYEGLPTRNRDLHRLHLPLEWRDHGDRWRVVLSPVVAASSNVFKDLPGRGSRQDLDLYGRWQYQRGTDSARGWRVALVRDAAFGVPRIYPAAALLWRGDRIAAELGLPSTRIDWTARDDLALGLAIFPSGGRWHVISDERGGAEFDYRARAWRGAASAGWSPLRQLRLHAQAGIEFARRYRFEDDLGAPIDRRAGSAAYWRLEVRFGF